MSESFPQKAKSFTDRIKYSLNRQAGLHTEFAVADSGVLSNYYKNILKLDGVHASRGLYEEFRNIPAIICGPGPSLDKNIDVLRTLGDRALIIAGGTGINALNAGGVIPHICVSIDPNTAQKTRIIASKSYDVPLLYRSR